MDQKYITPVIEVMLNKNRIHDKPKKIVLTTLENLLVTLKT